MTVRWALPRRHLQPMSPRSVAAEQDWPRLRVWRSPHRFWWWRLTGPHGETLDDGAVPTWDEAMAIGLAALEVASLTDLP